MILGRLSDKYWNWRGKRQVTVAGASATFDTSKRIYTGTTARSVRYFLSTESHVISEFLQSLRPDDVFYDIGAHIGFYTCFASNVITNGEIHSFEPDPRDEEVLLKNINCNTPKQVQHHPVLLSDEPGQQQFGGGSMADEQGEVVEVHRLDDYRAAHDLPDPTVMKIDIEGAELRALEGAVKTLESVRCCYIEVHINPDSSRSLREFGDTESDLLEFLDKHGFQVTRIGERKTEVHIKATSDKNSYNQK